MLTSHFAEIAAPWQLLGQMQTRNTVVASVPHPLSGWLYLLEVNWSPQLRFLSQPCSGASSSHGVLSERFLTQLFGGEKNKFTRVCLQFYSILDGDEDMLFMHVDNPGGNNHTLSENASVMRTFGALLAPVAVMETLNGKS